MHVLGELKGRLVSIEYARTQVDGVIVKEIRSDALVVEAYRNTENGKVLTATGYINRDCIEAIWVIEQCGGCDGGKETACRHTCQEAGDEKEA